MFNSHLFMKYFLEGSAVAIIAYFVPTEKFSSIEIALICFTSVAIAIAIDHFATSHKKNKPKYIKIFQHPQETPGTWQKAIIFTTAPLDENQYISAIFDNGQDFVYNYFDKKNYITAEKRDLMIKDIIESQGWKEIDPKYATNYGVSTH